MVYKLKFIYVAAVNFQFCTYTTKPTSTATTKWKFTLSSTFLSS